MNSEWDPLREAIVGRPYYRIVRPFPDARREQLGERAWQLLKRQEGQLLGDAFPRLHRRLQEHMDRAANVLSRAGVRIHPVPAFAPGEEAIGAVDSPTGTLQCFPRDLLLQVGSLVIELAPANPLRRVESLPLRRLLRQQQARLGLESIRMPRAATAEPAAPCLEGGDCLQSAGEIYVGLSGAASNRAGIDWLQARLGPSARIIPVPLDAEYPHLDLAMAFVRPGLGVICRRALRGGLPPTLTSWRWIELDRNTALRHMAANLLPLDEGTTLVAAEAEALARELRSHGQRVLQTPVSGLAWLGGGLRCWCQPLRPARGSRCS